MSMRFQDNRQGFILRLLQLKLKNNLRIMPYTQLFNFELAETQLEHWCFETLLMSHLGQLDL